MNRGQMINAVLGEGGFDSTTAASSRDVIAGWLNEALGTMVAESQWSKASVNLGPTVVGQSAYAVPENVIDVRTVYVGGYEYMRLGPSEMLALRVSDAEISGGYGAFAPGYSLAGTAVVDVFPSPTVAGVAITALCSLAAVEMTEDSDVPMVPVDFHQALVDKAIGTGYRRVYERHDEADRFDARFSNANPGSFGAVQKLKRRANSRIGTGPQRIRIVS